MQRQRPCERFLQGVGKGAHYGGWAALIGAYEPFWYVMQPAGLVTELGTGLSVLPPPLKTGVAQAVLPAAHASPAKKE